jgi:predicted DNA-binding protein (UPF0251 family)
MSDALTADELHDEARKAMDLTYRSQAGIAEAIGVHRSSVCRALQSAGLKYAAVQARIVSHVRGCDVRKESIYRSADVVHRWYIDRETVERR